jgi:hypothetical protein
VCCVRFLGLCELIDRNDTIINESFPWIALGLAGNHVSRDERVPRVDHRDDFGDGEDDRLKGHGRMLVQRWAGRFILVSRATTSHAFRIARLLVDWVHLVGVL